MNQICFLKNTNVSRLSGTISINPSKKYIVLLILLMNSAWAISQVNVAKGKPLSGSMSYSMGEPSVLLVDGDIKTGVNVGGLWGYNDDETIVYYDGDLIIDFKGNAYINSIKVYQNEGLEYITLYYYKNNNWVLLSSKRSIPYGDFTVTFPEVYTTKFKMVCNEEVDLLPDCWISEVEVYGRMETSINYDIANIDVLSSKKIDVNGVISIFGSGLDGTNYQKTVIYSDVTNGLYFDAPLKSNGSGLPINFAWRGGSPKVTFLPTGNVLIGKTTQTYNYKLDVMGTIRAQEVKIDLAGKVADFVFAPDYKLRPLFEVEKYVKANFHLPEIPSAAEVAKNGLSLGEMQNKLLQKVEELTLYMIELKKENEALKEKIEKLSTKRGE